MEYIKEKLDELYDRFHRPENYDRYNKLIVHTGEVINGSEIVNLFNESHKIIREFEKYRPEMQLGQRAQLRRNVDKIEKWLDDNHWAK